MNASRVDQIAQAVLYEGYILYPYRPSAAKNRQRFTFGRVYPRAYSIAQRGTEPDAMQTECLVRRRSQAAQVEVRVRFLHPVVREVGELPVQHRQRSDGCNPQFETVSELTVEGRLYQRWHEAVEGEVALPLQPLVATTSCVELRAPASRSLEQILNSQGEVKGVLQRRREALAGRVELKLSPLDAGVFKLTVRLENLTPVPEAELANAEGVLLRTLASTHTILHVQDGEFLSLLDPPSAWAAAVGDCRNVGTWPVLVGDEERGERDTMLSSPIILYDYPRVAPESAGDLCDGTEIDELLSLRIQTLSEAEKWEMRDADAFARRILERTESLSEDEVARMHGAMRPVRSLEEQIFNRSAPLEEVCVEGVGVRRGDRVRIRPKARADVMDLVLAGKVGVIESIEQDAEERVHLALVIEEDPGRDLGLSRQPGHRFFYGTDEVELVREVPA